MVRITALQAVNASSILVIRSINLSYVTKKAPTNETWIDADVIVSCYGVNSRP